MRCVVVEDTAIGATAGKAANMKVGLFFQTLGVSKGAWCSVRILMFIIFEISPLVERVCMLFSEDF